MCRRRYSRPPLSENGRRPGVAKDAGFGYCIDKTRGLSALETLLRSEAASLQDDEKLAPPG